MLIDKNISTIINVFEGHFNDYEKNHSFDIVNNNLAKGVFVFTFGNVNKNVFNGFSKIPHKNHLFIQKCFRTDTNNKIGISNNHLTTFILGGLHIFNQASYSELILDSINFLEKINISPNMLSLNIREDSIVSNKDVIELKNLGIKINFLSNSDLNLEIPNCPFNGERIEIFHCSKKVELINISIVEHHLDKHLIDCGFSFERLSMISNNIKSVFELKPHLEIIKNLNRCFTKVSKFSINYLSDTIVAVNQALNNGVSPGSKGNSNKIRQLLKKAFFRLVYFEEDIFQIIQFFQEKHRDVIKKEVRLYQKNFSKADVLFKSYLKDVNEFDLTKYLENQVSDSGFFDKPKLQNEELLILASRKVPVINFNNSLCKKYNIHQEFISLIKTNTL